MRRQLNRKVIRLEKKLSAKTKRPQVLFLLPGEDLDEAKRQRFGDEIPDDAELLIVSFRGTADASAAQT